MAALASPRTAPDETIPATRPAPSLRHALRHQPAAPVRMAMYFSPEGTLHHARCRRPLDLRGVRAELEIDFWCRACHEHVTLPTYAIPQIPVQSGHDRDNVVRLPLP